MGPICQNALFTTHKNLRFVAGVGNDCEEKIPYAYIPLQLVALLNQILYMCTSFFIQMCSDVLESIDN